MSRQEDYILGMRTLKQDWDSYGAEPIASDTINRARTLLLALESEPVITPCNDGSISFEWANVEICVGSLANVLFIDDGP